MAGFFNPYQQMYNPNYYQNGNGYPQQAVVSNNPTPQIQNGGFMVVPNEDIVSTYPVAAGNCITFKIEGKPIVMEKSMGFSQLESPKIERYRLIKEDTPIKDTNTAELAAKDSETPNSTIESINGEIRALWRELDALKEQIADQPKKTVSKKKEVTSDDAE